MRRKLFGFGKTLSNHIDVIEIPDSKAEADHHKWEYEMSRRKRGPGKRGRAPISKNDLAEEFEVKKEKCQRMDEALKELQERTRDEILEDSDLDAYEELLNSDMEDSETESTDNDNGKRKSD